MQESTAAGKTEWVDPDDAPELTDDFFDDAEIWDGDKFIRRGRMQPGAREVVTLTLDADVLRKLRSFGPGWQARVNDLLRRALSGAPDQPPA